MHSREFMSYVRPTSAVKFAFNLPSPIDAHMQCRRSCLINSDGEPHDSLGQYGQLQQRKINLYNDSFSCGGRMCFSSIKQ